MTPEKNPIVKIEPEQRTRVGRALQAGGTDYAA